jgi:hypothetical protein
MNKINIVTPCSRFENLHEIANSINIPIENYTWTIVVDAITLPDNFYIPYNSTVYCIKDYKSICGNAQRNYALDLIKDGWVAFLDDDTVLHRDLWENVKDLNNDFISFAQEWKDGNLRLKGNDINLNSVDSGNIIIHHSLIGTTRWDITRRDADGLFAHACKLKAKSYLFIPKVLSTYNALR